MNERIRELAEQAGAEIYGHPDHATICVNGQDADALMKKFAESIVNECIDYCGENLSKTVGAALKIHFGVE